MLSPSLQGLLEFSRVLKHVWLWVPLDWDLRQVLGVQTAPDTAEEPWNRSQL